jgi:diguanylate cyclase (GGDEF)-like protein
MNSTVASALMWSLGVQLGVVSLIAVFFSILANSVRLIQVRMWAWAWIAYAIATASCFLLLNMGVEATTLHSLSLSERILLMLYIGGKTAYGLLLIQGIRLHFKPGVPPRFTASRLVAISSLWGIALGLTAQAAGLVLPVQWFVVAVVLCTGGIWALKQTSGTRSHWLSWVVLGEGILYLAYVPALTPLLWGNQPQSHLLEYSSLFDAAADLLLALATLVALESARSENLERANHELQTSQEKLRQLVDLDPLTGLTNRRGLRMFLDTVRDYGATLIFLDIDRFKDINDRHGHAVGDACLVRMATLLIETFRPQDGLFRWGGDEFLVVVRGLDPTLAEKRIESFRAAIANGGADTPPISISLGLTRLEPGVKPDQALHEADQRMYADKRRRALL